MTSPRLTSVIVVDIEGGVVPDFSQRFLLEPQALRGRPGVGQFGQFFGDELFDRLANGTVAMCGRCGMYCTYGTSEGRDVKQWRVGVQVDLIPG